MPSIKKLKTLGKILKASSKRSKTKRQTKQSTTHFSREKFNPKQTKRNEICRSELRSCATIMATSKPCHYYYIKPKDSAFRCRRNKFTTTRCSSKGSVGKRQTCKEAGKLIDLHQKQISRSGSTSRNRSKSRSKYSNRSSKNSSSTYYSAEGY